MALPIVSPTELNAETDEQVLERVYHHRLAIEREQRWLYDAEQEALRRMAERGATSIPNERFICEVQTRDTYDQVSFTPLKEVFSAADLAEVFTPEHDEVVTVKESWNTVKTKAKARRYGSEALAIVERAKTPGRPTLKFRER